MTPRSLNEAEQMARKAALGADYSHGVAEDAARATAALLMHGYDGIAAIRQALSTAAPSAVIGGGMAMFEEAAAADGGRRQMDNIDAPLLLIGIALVATADYQQAATITFPAAPGGIWKINNGDIATAATLPAASDTPTTAALIITPSTAPAPPRHPYQRIPINEDDWQYLNRLAEKTYIPESEESRRYGAGAGAGAGNVDNE